jgi:hypothetical protein
LHNQQDDGSYKTDFLSKKNSGVDYFPGEAMLCLMKLYYHTKNKQYLDSVDKAFPFYRAYWRKHKKSAFVPWHTQTYLLLYQETKNKEVADFAFEMNDWLINKYQIVESRYADEIGGAPKNGPKISMSAYMEGIADAYQLAVMADDEFHMKKYLDSAGKGTRFLCQIQFTQNNTFFLKNPPKAIGGFMFSLRDTNIRCDNTQHSMLALMKVAAYGIFDESGQ